MTSRGIQTLKASSQILPESGLMKPRRGVRPGHGRSKNWAVGGHLRFSELKPDRDRLAVPDCNQGRETNSGTSSLGSEV